ncbi:MAG: glycoside hydrolase family 2 protein, partial [Chloroflexota bacterium]
ELEIVSEEIRFLGENGFLKGGDAWRLRITNKGERAALGVWLTVARAVREPGYAYFDDNFIHLLPGEERTITVIWDGIPPEERAIGIGALNAEERIFHG